jgi:hypothetical protein
MWIILFICHLKDSEVIRLDNLLRKPAIFKNKEEEYDFSNMFLAANENSSHFNQSQNMTEEDYDFNQAQNMTCLSFLDGEYAFKCNTFKPFLNVILPFMIILGGFLIVWFEPIIWRKR